MDELKAKDELTHYSGEDNYIRKNVDEPIRMNRVYWAIGAQVLFAIFLIVAFYGIGYAFKNAADSYINLQGIDPKHITLGQLTYGSLYDIDTIFQTSFNLAVASIVFAFVGIVIPGSSFLFRNKTDSKIITYTMLITDALVFILAIASVSVVLNELTVTDGSTLVTYIYNNYPAASLLGSQAALASKIKSVLGSSIVYKSGYAAGMFIMIFVGYGLALAGNIYAYKNYFKLMF